MDDKFFISSDFVGASIGLAVTQAINLVGMCNWGLRQTAELENQMTSVERVIEYANLPSERSLESSVDVSKKLSPNFPNSNNIKFKNVSLKYSDNGEHVLRNLSFEVKENVKKICNVRENFIMKELSRKKLESWAELVLENLQ